MSADVPITLSGDEALVLFDWLAQFNQRHEVDFRDQAERRVLWDLEAQLERVLASPLADDYGVQLAEARARLRDTDR